MTDFDPRSELADIAATLRRYLQREHAGGTAELLAREAARRETAEHGAERREAEGVYVELIGRNF